MKINSDSPFFIPTLILFIAFFALIYKCIYSESNINRIEPILRKDSQILAQFGYIKDYRIDKSTILFGNYPAKHKYVYRLKVYGERDNGTITLKVDENKLSADYPYKLKID
ncbi:hypothetical protein HI850_010825 [bacterium SPL81]|nr:hypothetical protein [Acinetobacter baumannii]